MSMHKDNLLNVLKSNGDLNDVKPYSGTRNISDEEKTRIFNENMKKQKPYVEKEPVRIGRVNQWISVEDRLPDNDGWYLVYKFKQVRVAEWFESCWYNERDLPIDDVAISHWMPLPEPPNKT